MTNSAVKVTVTQTNYFHTIYSTLLHIYTQYPTISTLIILLSTIILCLILLPEIRSDLFKSNSKPTKSIPDIQQSTLTVPSILPRTQSNGISPLRNKRNVISPLTVTTDNNYNSNNGNNNATVVVHDDMDTHSNPYTNTVMTPVSSVRMSYSRDTMNNTQNIDTTHNDSIHNTDLQSHSNQVQLMCNGANFLKFGRFGRPHTRRLSMRMHNNQLQLYWQTGDLLVDQILDVVAGKQTSVYNRRENRMADVNLCFSVITKKRTLDLQADTQEQRDAWVNGIKRLANIYDSPHQAQRDTSHYQKENSTKNNNNIVNVSSSSNQYINAVLNQYPKHQQEAVQIALTQSKFPSKPTHTRIGSLSNKLYSTRLRNKSISNNNSQLIDNTSAHYTPRTGATTPQSQQPQGKFQYAATQPIMTHLHDTSATNSEIDDTVSIDSTTRTTNNRHSLPRRSSDYMDTHNPALTHVLSKQTQLISQALSPVQIHD